MKTVSAVPENMFSYSGTCTRAAQELQDWVRTVLAPLIAEYQRGGGECFTVDRDVAVQIAAAYYTDRDVRSVGQAFQNAGTPTARPGEEQQYLATEKALAGQDALAAGRALAGRMPKAPSHDDIERITEELLCHTKDPYFYAGFFNSLTASQLQELLGHGTNIQALVSAYSSGSMTPAATRNLVHALGWLQGEDISVEHQHITVGEQNAVLDQLAADPVAAKNFANSLTRQQIRSLFYGEASRNPALRANLVDVLTSAVGQSPDPASARELMHKVSIGLFGDGAPTLTNDQWKPVAIPLRDFYDAGMVHSIAPPTDLSHDGLEEWERTTGKAAGQDVGLLLKAMNAADPDDELIKSMVQGGYVSLGFVPVEAVLPEGLVVTASLGALQSMYSAVDPGAKWIDDAFPENDKPNSYRMNKKLAAGAFVQSIGILAARGMVRDPSGKLVPPPRTSEDLTRLLNTMLHSRGSRDGYKVGAKGPSVNEMLDAFKGSERDLAVDALGNPHYKAPYE